MESARRSKSLFYRIAFSENRSRFPARRSKGTNGAAFTELQAKKWRNCRTKGYSERASFCGIRTGGRTKRTASIGAAAKQSEQRRHNHSFEVEPNRPILDIFQVVTDAFLHHVRIACFSAETMNLGPPSDSWLNAVPVRVTLNQVTVVCVVSKRTLQ